MFAWLLIQSNNIRYENEDLPDVAQVARLVPVVETTLVVKLLRLINFIQHKPVFLAQRFESAELLLALRIT